MSEEPERLLLCSCKPDKISSMFSSFDIQKVNLLKSIGFGGLLKLPVLDTLNDEFSLWLYKRFDYKKMCLHLDRGIDLPIRDPDVYLAFGLPFKSRSVDVSQNLSKDSVSSFKEKICTESNSSSLTMSYVEHILGKEYESGFSPHESDAFKIACVLYSVCYFLGPETKHQFPLHLIKNFLPVVEPADINWAQFLLWTIGRASSHAIGQLNEEAKTICIFGCCHFLQVFYLDNLNFGPSTPYHVILPRAAAYSSKFMSELIDLDSIGISDEKIMIFGKNQVREETDVCYVRGWTEKINMQTHLQRPGLNDYMSSIENLAEGLQLFDNFATQVNQLNVSAHYRAQEILEATKTAYMKFRAKTNNDIHCLCKKAVDIIRMRIMNLYYHNIPDPDNSTSAKRVLIGTSSDAMTKRSKGSDSLANKTVVSEEAPDQGNPCQTQDMLISRNNVLYDQSSSSHSQQSCFQKKTVTSHSKFPVSCFDIMYTHPEVDWTNKFKCYTWMTNPELTNLQLNRDWIVFTAPKYLSITGNVMKTCLKLNGSFTVSLVDAIMVLWNYLDAKVYNLWNDDEETHIRWRHFLPASFAEMVINGDDFLNSDAIRACFIGDHITYNVEDCQKIILPVACTGEHWSCYFWDFKLRTITILDPLLMDSSPAKARKKHQETVFNLHRALFACKDNFFSGWGIEGDGWTDVYLTNLGYKCKPQNSGLYAVHYARSFCGSDIAFKLKEPYESTLCEPRGEIVYHMFTCAENKGYKPTDLMESIHHIIL